MTNSENTQDQRVTQEPAPGTYTQPPSKTPTSIEADDWWARTDKLKEDIDKLRERVDKFDERLVESQSRNIEILALFVALFTFVSIEFQLAKSFDFSQFLFFSPLFAALLIFFVLALHVTVNDRVNLKSVIFILFLILIFITSAFFARPRNTTISPRSKNLDIEKINVEQLRIDPQAP